jgi:thioredoxin-related protein
VNNTQRRFQSVFDEVSMRSKGCFLIIAFLFLPSVTAFSEGINWSKDLNSALAEAKRSDKILMVDVYTEWCGWCKRLDQDTYTDPAVIARSAKFVSLKIDAEKEPDGVAFAKKYRVSAYPTILFLEPDGSVINRIGGYLNGADFFKTMQKTSEYRVKNSSALLSMLTELGRVEEAIVILETLSSKGALKPAETEIFALSIGSSLVESGEYKQGLVFLKKVEEFNSNTDSTYAAFYYHSIALYYEEGPQKALTFLNQRLASEALPETWKTRYQELKDQISGAGK